MILQISTYPPGGGGGCLESIRIFREFVRIFEILNFKPSHTVENAVTDLKNALIDGKLPDSLTDEKYYNIKKMNSINTGK